MAKGTVNWDSQETWQRVIASIIASGVKLDLKAVAKYFGTTYDTIENRFRKIKKEAATLKEEVDSGERGETVAPSRVRSNAGTPRKPKAPRNDVLNGVANGRITKSTPRKKPTVKHEDSEETSEEPLSDLSMDIGGTYWQSEALQPGDLWPL